MGDPRQLVWLFAELITNALKFRSEAPPRIHIWAERHGAWWRFAMRDNGQGLAPHHASRAFALFERLQAEAAKPGTGAGLAIAQRVVGRLGGRIWLESATGGGTIFFTAPAVPLNPPTDPSDYGVMESSKTE